MLHENCLNREQNKEGIFLVEINRENDRKESKINSSWGQGRRVTSENNYDSLQEEWSHLSIILCLFTYRSSFERLLLLPFSITNF